MDKKDEDISISKESVKPFEFTEEELKRLEEINKQDSAFSPFYSNNNKKLNSYDELRDYILKTFYIDIEKEDNEDDWNNTIMLSPILGIRR